MVQDSGLSFYITNDTEYLAPSTLWEPSREFEFSISFRLDGRRLNISLVRKILAVPISAKFIKWAQQIYITLQLTFAIQFSPRTGKVSDSEQNLGNLW